MYNNLRKTLGFDPQIRRLNELYLQAPNIIWYALINVFLSAVYTTILNILIIAKY